MTRTIAILAALIAFAPASLAGDAPGNDGAKPAAEGATSTASEDSTIKEMKAIEGGFSIPAADSDSKDQPKK